MTFDYGSFTGRNLGFVDASEQQLLREASVFVCGVGGMGGAAFMALARAGIGKFVIADIDRFEVSNLNRQVFAFNDEVGREKADVAAEAARRINPSIEIDVLGANWTSAMPDIARRCPVIVNGMDDIAAGVHLYRTARQAKAAVIDAYMSPLPSVIVVRPTDPRPEERLGFPTLGKDWRSITDADKRAAMLAEIEHVMLHSSSRHYVDLAIAGEVAAGRRSRMSFAPMVISTGMLMAYEAIALILGRSSGADCRGWFGSRRVKPQAWRSQPISALADHSGFNEKLTSLAGVGTNFRLVNVFRVGLPDKPPARPRHFRQPVAQLIV